MSAHQLADNSKYNGIPLYLQVQQTLRQMIDDGEFETGEQIPSERELSEMLGVSRMTVRRAVENLVHVGLLERQSTSGTFVRQPSVVRHVGSNYSISITQLLAEDGSQAGSQLLNFEFLRAPRKVAEYLQLQIGDPVVKIQRLRLVNNVPFCIETSHIPAGIVPDLDSFDLQGDVSLYTILRQRYDIDLVRSSGTVKISRCLQDEADLLQLDEGDPVMFMTAVVYDINDNRIEYLKSINHPERVTFRTFRHLEQ